MSLKNKMVLTISMMGLFFQSVPLQAWNSADLQNPLVKEAPIMHPHVGQALAVAGILAGLALWGYACYRFFGWYLSSPHPWDDERELAWDSLYYKEGDLFCLVTKQENKIEIRRGKTFDLVDGSAGYENSTEEEVKRQVDTYIKEGDNIIDKKTRAVRFRLPKECCVMDQG